MSKTTKEITDKYPLIVELDTGMIYGHCEYQEAKFALKFSAIQGFFQMEEDHLVNVMVDGKPLTVFATFDSFDDAYREAKGL